jgi:hypothetical protein
MKISGGVAAVMTVASYLRLTDWLAGRLVTSLQTALSVAVVCCHRHLWYCSLLAYFFNDIPVYVINYKMCIVIVKLINY